MKKQSAEMLMKSAHLYCDAVAHGPFTPIVFERWEPIGGSPAWMLGRPSATAGGKGCIVWSVFSSRA